MTDVHWKDRPVALTGATGFVGHQVASHLRQAGAAVTAVVRTPSRAKRLQPIGVQCRSGDLGDVDSLVAAFTGCDTVFHIAGAVDFGADRGQIRSVNVDGTRNVIDAVRRAGVRRLVFTSSIVAVHGSRTPTVVDETAEWNLGDLDVPYASTKREAEEVVLAAAAEGLDAVVVNPASVVGPDDFASSEFGLLCRRFWKGRIPFYAGGGNNFVDVRHVAGGHLLAAERGRTGERYLLANENCTYGEFFAMLARTAGRFIPRMRLPLAVARVGANLADRFVNKPGKRPYLTSEQTRMLARYFYFDAAKARRELGYAPRPLADSLADAHRFWRRDRRAA